MSFFKHFRSAICVALCSTCAVAPDLANAVPLYTFTALGTLGGSSSLAYGINNNGQIVGESDTTGGARRATLWSGGTAIDLGTLGGTTGLAYSISHNGLVAGWSATTAGPAQYGTLWSGGTAIDLGMSLAYGVNDLDRWWVCRAAQPSGVVVRSQISAAWVGARAVRSQSTIPDKL